MGWHTDEWIGRMTPVVGGIGRKVGCKKSIIKNSPKGR